MSAEDLIAFSRTMLDAEEAAAKATAPGGRRLAWTTDVQVDDDGHVVGHCVISTGDVAGVAGAWGLERGTGEQVAAHIARYDPARALREVAAKRAILARHKPLHGVYGLCCAWCSDDVDAPRLNKPWPCEDVRDLVSVWSDQPGYSADWKP